MNPKKESKKKDDTVIPHASLDPVKHRALVKRQKVEEKKKAEEKSGDFETVQKQSPETKIDIQEPEIVSNSVRLAHQFPELTTLQIQILTLLWYSKSPFPHKAWGIANWLRDLLPKLEGLTPEQIVETELERLLSESKYQIRKLPYNGGIGFEFVK